MFNDILENCVVECDLFYFSLPQVHKIVVFTFGQLVSLHHSPSTWTFINLWNFVRNVWCLMS